MNRFILILSILFSSALFARLPHVDLSADIDAAVAVDFEALESVATEQGRTPDALRKLAESYLVSHRVQEAIWTLREAGDFGEALELTRNFQSFLSIQPVTGGEFLGGRGGATARRVYYSRAISGVFKRASSNICGDAEYEQAAYWLDELLALDVVPITVLVLHPEFGLGSMQYFVHGRKALSVKSPRHREGRMRLIDLILGNRDRNSGNWLVRPGGFVVAIDHGNSHPLSEFVARDFPYGILEDELLLRRILLLESQAFRERLGHVLSNQTLDAVWGRIQRLKDKILVHKPYLGGCAWRFQLFLRRVLQH